MTGDSCTSSLQYFNADTTNKQTVTNFQSKDFFLSFLLFLLFQAAQKKSNFSSKIRNFFNNFVQIKLDMIVDVSNNASVAARLAVDLWN